jgi:hypothetical protein
VSSAEECPDDLDRLGGAAEDHRDIDYGMIDGGEMDGFADELLEAVAGGVDIVVAGLEERDRVLAGRVGEGLGFGAGVFLGGGDLSAHDGSAGWISYSSTNGAAECL